MNLAETLKNLRLEAELTQTELAKKLGIGQSTIVGYEKGDREATATNLVKYANFFSVSLDFLCGLEDDFGAKSYLQKEETSVSLQKQSTANTNMPALLNDEQQLLALYRKMNRTQKSHFIGFAEGMLGVTSANKLS